MTTQKLFSSGRLLAIKTLQSGVLQRNAAAFSTTSVKNDTVGFIGLGNMGCHMANNLMKKGHSLVVYDITKEAVDNAVKSGAKAASNPAEVASQCEKVITMLPSTPHVQEVYCGSDGILSTVKSGSLLVDCSTIDPLANIALEKAAKEKGASYMDSPVSGGVNGARDAVLTFMVGGSEPDFEKAKTILSLMGKNVIHCGAISTGQAAKICNNMMLAISMTGTSEAIHLGISLGLDPKMLSQILSISTGRCWSVDTYNPCPGVMPGVPSSNDYAGGFGVALMTKDLGLAQNAATATQTPTPLGSLAHQIYRMMTNGEYAEKDFSSVFKFLEQMKK